MKSKVRLHNLLDDGAALSDLRARTVRGGLVAMVAEAADFVLRLGSIAVLARLLVPEHFGLIGMVTAITAIAERFKDFGLSVATVQRPNITYDQVTALFWVNAMIGVGIAVLVAALAVPISHFYGDHRLTAITLALASTFVFSGMTTQHQALLRRQLKFGPLAIVQVMASVLSTVVAVALALAGFDYWALVVREVCRAIFLAAGTWLALPWVPGRPRKVAGVGSMLAFGGHVSLFNLVSTLGANLDQIVVGKLFGAVSLGYYRQGANLAMSPIIQLMYPVNSVAEPTLSRLQGATERYRRYYHSILTAMCFLTMPLAGFFAVFADELVKIMLGPAWSDATGIFRLLAIAAFIRPAALTVGFVMVTSGKSRRYVVWGLLNAFALGFTVLLGAQFGAAGVASAHIVTSYLLLVPLTLWAFRGTPVKAQDFVLAVSRPLTAGLATSAVAWVVKLTLDNSGALVTLGVGAVISAVFFIGSYLALPGGRAELTRALSDLRSAVSGR